MPKKKSTLAAPKTKPTRAPRGRTATGARADQGVDVSRTAGARSSSSRRRTLQRMGRDAAAPLETATRRTTRVATPKRKRSPQQLKSKGRSVARQRSDAPRRG